MNPQLLMMALPMIMSALNIGGSEGEMKSTYNKQQRGGINDVLEAIKGMGGAQGTNINANPQFQQGNEWMQSLFNDEGFFKNFEAPAMRQFNEEIAPSIASRFASSGSGGSLGSTGFRNSINRAGADLATNLSAMRTGMQQNAIPQMMQSANMPFNNMMQMLNTALGHPTENVYQPPSNPWAPLAGAGMQGWMQSMGMGQNQKFSGQSPSTM